MSLTSSPSRALRESHELRRRKQVQHRNERESSDRKARIEERERQAQSVQDWPGRPCECQRASLSRCEIRSCHPTPIGPVPPQRVVQDAEDEEEPAINDYCGRTVPVTDDPVAKDGRRYREKGDEHEDEEIERNDDAVGAYELAEHDVVIRPYDADVREAERERDITRPLVDYELLQAR